MFKKKTTEKAYSGQEVVENIQKKNEEASGLKVLAREFAKDRGALGALILLIILFLGIFIGALFLNTDKVMTVDIFKQYTILALTECCSAVTKAAATCSRC